MLRAALALALCLLAGCQSAAEKCSKARNAANESWAGYVAALEAVRAAAVKTQTDVQQRMTSVVEPRLMPEAQKIADGRYDRSAEAWLRASKTAFTDLCGKDTECNALREQRMQANATLGDMDERLPLAIAARDAQRGAVEAALDASKGTVIDPERPALKAAQQLTLALAEQCEGVPPEASP
jgi:hypothetical protein